LQWRRRRVRTESCGDIAARIHCDGTRRGRSHTSSTPSRERECAVGRGG
jgi:hypothetical protein